VNKGIFDINPPYYTYAFGQVPLNNNAIVQMPYGCSNTIQTQTPNPQPVSTYPMPLGLPALNKDDEMIFVIDTTLGSNSDFGFAPNSGGAAQGAFAGGISISVDWGDGNTSTFNNAPGANGGSTDGVSNNNSYFAHTYTNNGVYVVRIRGGYMGGIASFISNSNYDSKVIRWISFGDNLGTTYISTGAQYASPMINLVELPNYLPTSVTTLDLRGCASITNINNWDVSRVTSASFYGSNLYSRLDNWNVSNFTSMYRMFYSTNFNSEINGWDVSKVQNMAQMFGSSTFNQNIGNWNLAGLNGTSALDGFMSGTLSTSNYDAILIGWNNNKLVGANGVANWRTDLRPDFGLSKYSTAASAARAALVAYGWTITDGGPA